MAAGAARPVPVVGIDMVRVADVAASVARFGSRYLERIYTAGELAYAGRGTIDERNRRLAARFAAKEATLKVLAPSGHWFDWRHLEVIRDPAGPCFMRLHGAAARLALQQDLGALAMSLTHEEPFAVAVVTGLRWPGNTLHASDPQAGYRLKND